MGAIKLLELAVKKEHGCPKISILNDYFCNWYNMRAELNANLAREPGNIKIYNNEIKTELTETTQKAQAIQGGLPKKYKPLLRPNPSTFA